MPYNPYGGYPGFANIQSGTSDINGVPQVSSIEEVKAASVPYGVSIFFTKDNSNLFYAKNSNGLIKCFKYQEVPIPSNDPQNFVTKQEFDDLRTKYEQLAQQYATVQPATTATTVQSSVYNASDAELPGNTGTSEAAILQPGSSDGIDPFTVG